MPTPLRPSSSLLPTAPATPSPSTRLVRRGAQGEPVRQLQQALVQLGHLTQAQLATGPGVFGPRTEAALRAFQRAWGLVADGVEGPRTREALERALAGEAPPVARPRPAHAQANVLEGLSHSDGFGRRVALTFDDGPHPVHTPQVLDILARFGVKATFFVTGQNVERFPELVRRIVAEGHSLGSHSFRHQDLARLDRPGVEADLARTQAAVDRALGHPQPLRQVRPPYGSLDGEVRDALRARGEALVLWNVDSNDWRYREDDARILAHVFAGASSVYARGGVILFHDIHPQTVRVLDDVLERLQREGFRILKTDALLQGKHPRS